MPFEGPDARDVSLKGLPKTVYARRDRYAEEIFERSTALDAKYIVKIITSELRIGLKESLVEAIAAAHDRPLASVRRANMLTGDIGATLQMALDDFARLRA